MWIILILNFVKINLGHEVFDNTGDFTNSGAVVVEVGIAITITLVVHFYAQNSQKKINEIIIDLRQERERRRTYALSRLRLLVNQIIHYLQDMEKRLDDNSTDNVIFSCLQNSKAQINEIENILRISSSDIDLSLSNTLRKRCEFLNFYYSTYKIRETIGPSKVGLLTTFGESFMEISSSFYRSSQS